MKQRWLLDHNVPKQLVEWLRGKGIVAETAFGLGWHDLDDQELLKRANESHQVLLTRDKRFAEAAGFPTTGQGLSVVILQLPQAPAAAFVAAFELAWAAGAVQPKAGAVTLWP